MMKARIVIEQCPNPHFQEFHCTALLSEARRQEFKRPLRDSSEKYLKLLGEKGAGLIHTLFGIAGVAEVFISPYEITVVKGEAFDWKDIQPETLEALKAVFAAHGMDAESVEVVGAV